jgi:uncharacterized membrane protein
MFRSWRVICGLIVILVALEFNELPHFWKLLAWHVISPLLIEGLLAEG